jgi:hypothetical protein
MNHKRNRSVLHLTAAERKHWEDGETMRYFIYTLTDPRTGSIFYVGCTTNVKRREAQHNLYKHSPEVEGIKYVTYLANLRQAGCKPVMVVVEQTEDKTREEYWIEHFSSWCSLVNVHFTLTDSKRVEMQRVVEVAERKAERMVSPFRCGHERLNNTAGNGSCRMCKSAWDTQWQREHPEAVAAIQHRRYATMKTKELNSTKI